MKSETINACFWLQLSLSTSIWCFSRPLLLWYLLLAPLWYSCSDGLTFRNGWRSSCAFSLTFCFHFYATGFFVYQGLRYHLIVCCFGSFLQIVLEQHLRIGLSDLKDVLVQLWSKLVILSQAKQVGFLCADSKAMLLRCDYHLQCFQLGWRGS